MITQKIGMLANDLTLKERMSAELHFDYDQENDCIHAVFVTYVKHPNVGPPTKETLHFGKTQPQEIAEYIASHNVGVSEAWIPHYAIRDLIPPRHFPLKKFNALSNLG